LKEIAISDQNFASRESVDDKNAVYFVNLFKTALVAVDFGPNSLPK